MNILLNISSHQKNLALVVSYNISDYTDRVGESDVDDSNLMLLVLKEFLHGPRHEVSVIVVADRSRSVYVYRQAFLSHQ